MYCWLRTAQYRATSSTMKKTILAAIFSLCITAGAQATTYIDNNPANVWLNALNPSYTGEFTLAGYNPATETITSAVADFTFQDLLGGNESLRVDLSGDILTSGSFSGKLLLSTGVINSLFTLDQTGILSYTVSLESGCLTEFWLDNAKLTAQAGTRNVPDSGATVALLGLGLVGLVAAKRRFRSS